MLPFYNKNIIFGWWYPLSIRAKA